MKVAGVLAFFVGAIQAAPHCMAGSFISELDITEPHHF